MAPLSILGTDGYYQATLDSMYRQGAQLQLSGPYVSLPPRAEVVEAHSALALKRQNASASLSSSELTPRPPTQNHTEEN